jgi:hypothetical protein
LATQTLQNVRQRSLHLLEQSTLSCALDIALLFVTPQPCVQADAYAQLQQLPFTGPLPNNRTTYCIYGSGVRTPRSLTYLKDFVSDELAEVPTASFNTTGDQVVTLSSLSLCDK